MLLDTFPTFKKYLQFKIPVAAVILLFFSINTYSQEIDSLSNQLDSLKKQADSTGQVNNTNPENYNAETRITPRVYTTLLLNDFKQQALSPFTITKQQWKTNAHFAVIAAGLFLLDKPVQKWSAKLNENNSWVKPVSNAVTNIGGVYEGVTFLGLAAYGHLAKNEKIKTTSILASQAYITTYVWESLFKVLSGRSRPDYIYPSTQKPSPTFHGPFFKDKDGKRLESGFPSGHSSVAFAAATVYAMEYRHKPIIPIISYSAASLISLSRLTLNRHWMTDVFVGAGLGILCGQQVVNNYHRFAKLKQGKKKIASRSLTFNIQYSSGHLMPGMLYKF